MAALTGDRNTPRTSGDIDHVPVKGGRKIFAGALVCRDAAGFAVPGATATGLRAAGRAEERIDNTAGADGAVRVAVRRGVFRYANSAGADEIGAAAIGEACYVVDDQTVAKTDGGGTRSRAGIVADVDEVGVWVLLSPLAVAI